MTDDVTRIIKQAVEAAKNAPEHLQEAAFNKAFDAMMGREQNQAPPSLQPRNKRKAGKKTPAPAEGEDQVSLDQLDRTSHTDIIHSNTSLNNSLRLILAAREDLGIDGLTAAQIAKVLVEVFRCKITRQAVSLALNGAGRYVNRHKEGNLVVFRIMAPGEEYLSAPHKTPAKGTSAARSGSKKRGNSKSAGVPGKKGNKKVAAIGTGAKSTLTILAKGSFFSTPKTISEIVEHCRHNLARSFKANDFSGKLARMVRGGELTRVKNSDKQYEYKKA